MSLHFNPVACRKAKIVCNFGLSECNWVKLTDTPSGVTVIFAKGNNFHDLLFSRLEA